MIYRDRVRTDFLDLLDVGEEYKTGNKADNYVLLVYRTYYLSLASFSSVLVDLYSSREAKSARGPLSATERRE